MSLHKEFNISKTQFYDALLDIRSFSGTKQGKKRLDPKVRVFLIFASILVFLVGMVFYNNNFSLDIDLIIAIFLSLGVVLTGFVVAIIVNYIMHKIWLSRNYSSAQASDYKQFFSIDENGLEISCKASDSRLKWKAIIKIEQGKKNLLFFIRRDSAIFIPLNLLDQQEIKTIYSWFKMGQMQAL